MNSIDSLKYSAFLIEQEYQQKEMNRYIQECILIGEGTNSIENIEAINEGISEIGSTIKEKIMKIVKAIGVLWAKFLEVLNNLAKSNKGYLDKYKDIILTKKLADATYTMYDYQAGLKVLVNATVPEFNFQHDKDNLADGEGEKFISKHFSDYTNSASKDSFDDQVKSKFRGSVKEIDISSDKINMTDVFNFCYDYEDKVKASLQKDINSIKNAGTDGIKTIDKMVEDGTVSNESYTGMGKRIYYSNVYESYIHEFEIKKEGDSNSSSGATSTKNDTATATNNDRKFSKNATNVKPNEPDPNDPNKKVDNDASIKQAVNNGEDAKKYGDAVHRYINICGRFLSCKESVYEEIYKNYMIIIKTHIRNTVGTEKETDNNKVREPDTNYKQNKGEQKPSGASADEINTLLNGEQKSTNVDPNTGKPIK